MGFRHALYTLMLLAGTSAAAQTVSPEQEVVISGKPVSDRQAVRAQVRAVTQRSGDAEDPLARFYDPVCIATLGLPRDMALTIADRMIEIAQSSGIPTRDGSCSPNIFVIFTDGAGEEIDRLARSSPRLMATISLEDLRGLRRQTGAVRSWSGREVRSRDGDPVMPSTIDMPNSLKVASGSRMVSNIRYDMRSSVLVIDREVLVGKSLIQISDYAAMRSFARTRSPKNPRVDTILSLFDEGAVPPAELTSFDRTYLRGLYAAKPNEFAYVHQAKMAAEIGEASAPRER